MNLSARSGDTCVPHSVESSTKDLGLETLRGLAIVLLVAAHSIGSMGLDEEAAWAYGVKSVEFLRVPLFAVISGCVYAMRPVSRTTWKSFGRGKFRRLVIPYLVLNPLLFVAMWLAPSNHTPNASEIFGVYLHPVAGMWFIQALLGCLLVVASLDLMGRLNSLRRALIALGISTVALLFGRSFVPFGFAAGAIYLLPFFLTGLVSWRFASQLKSHSASLILLTIAATGLALQQASLLGWLDLPVGRYEALSVLPGMAGTGLLIWHRKPIAPLAAIARYAMTAYLLHGFVVGALRWIWGSAGLPFDSAVVVVSVGAVLLVAAAYESVARHVALLRPAIGLRWTTETPAMRAKPIIHSTPPRTSAVRPPLRPLAPNSFAPTTR